MVTWKLMKSIIWVWFLGVMLANNWFRVKDMNLGSVHAGIKGSFIVSGRQLDVICLGVNTTCTFSSDSPLDLRFIIGKNNLSSKMSRCIFKSKIYGFPYELLIWKENLSHFFFIHSIHIWISQSKVAI